MQHLVYMARALALARQAEGSTWPNPMVGCVIVKDGRVLGEGFHRKPGQAHAELDAIQNANESVHGATVYVNLEPCCHSDKRTPPCAQRLIAEGVKQVVVANEDPNPAVSGQGIRMLRDAGIEVVTGVLAEDGELLNEVFFHNQRTSRPFVHLKLASTLDGRIAMPDGHSQWITGDLAREHGHRLRATHMAIAVGAGTIRHDNPSLTIRLPDYQGPQPVRVIFSKTGNIPPECRLLTDQHALRSRAFIDTPLDVALAALYQDGICNLLLEGGAGLATAFLQAQKVQRVSHYLNPSYLGTGLPALGNYGLNDLHQRITLKHVKYTVVGDDIVVTGRL